MEIRDAFQLAIKKFLDGTMPKELSSLKEEGLKYTPEYFDMMEKDLAEIRVPQKSKKKKAGEKTDG
jgi:hypothetical protein